jgi:chemotaxis protein methyltransferase CheR
MKKHPWRPVLANDVRDDVSEISAKAFAGLQELIFKAAGITMSDAKKSLMTGRLAKRLRALNLESYDEYLQYLTKGEGAHNNEFQRFVDLLTTNETYFYREPQHFDFLKQEILSRHEPNKLLRLWSAASSSGEEAYTLAMILSEALGVDGNWEIQGTDISTEMIKAARQGIYNEHRVRLVPKDIRRKYLLKGTKKYNGYVAVAPEIKRHVRFDHYNLVESPLRSEMFDVIFCRNVLIYFDQPTKKKVLERLCKQLKANCHLMTGHSESLHGMLPQLRSVKPSVYLNANPKIGK